ncbi:F-box domain containing protein [Madurella fahalii]|uniref:F-box domain containing protein n=1 Tax=Madurella fahalii TaxID=1157608 RepID=A0ABQ0GJ05_9PEZI
MASKYLIRVTAGPSYDISTHVQVPVNQAQPVEISSDLLDASLNVRVHNYRGLPRDAPETSVYFEREPHKYNGDQYSIALRFRLKDPSGGGEGEGERNVDGDEDGDGDGTEDGQRKGKRGVSAADLQFGNDFDHPIRDRLPPGFNTALNIVKWWIDPGLDGDAYADVPHLYGPALSSFNAVHVGEGENDPEKGGLWFEEGGDEDGMAWRDGIGAPSDAKARMKWALRQDSKEKWVWEYGRTYGVDFFNPYIDFNEFALRLPGFNLPIIKYWDGQGLRHRRKRSHQLRYVLRNRSTGQVYLVVLFTLHLAEDVNENGSLKPEALQALTHASGGQGKGEPLPDVKSESESGDDVVDVEETGFEEERSLNEAGRKLSGVDLDGKAPTSDDDID